MSEPEDQDPFHCRKSDPQNQYYKGGKGPELLSYSHIKKLSERDYRIEVLHRVARQDSLPVFVAMDRDKVLDLFWEKDQAENYLNGLPLCLEFPPATYYHVVEYLPK